MQEEQRLDEVTYSLTQEQIDDLISEGEVNLFGEEVNISDLPPQLRKDLSYYATLKDEDQRNAMIDSAFSELKMEDLWYAAVHGGASIIPVLGKILGVSADVINEVLSQLDFSDIKNIAVNAGKALFNFLAGYEGGEKVDAFMTAYLSALSNVSIVEGLDYADILIAAMTANGIVKQPINTIIDTIWGAASGHPAYTMIKDSTDHDWLLLSNGYRVYALSTNPDSLVPYMVFKSKQSTAGAVVSTIGKFIPVIGLIKGAVDAHKRDEMREYAMRTIEESDLTLGSVKQIAASKLKEALTKAYSAAEKFLLESRHPAVSMPSGTDAPGLQGPTQEQPSPAELPSNMEGKERVDAEEASALLTQLGIGEPNIAEYFERKRRVDDKAQTSKRRKRS